MFQHGNEEMSMNNQRRRVILGQVQAQPSYLGSGQVSFDLSLFYHSNCASRLS